MVYVFVIIHCLTSCLDITKTRHFHLETFEAIGSENTCQKHFEEKAKDVALDRMYMCVPADEFMKIYEETKNGTGRSKINN